MNLAAVARKGPLLVYFALAYAVSAVALLAIGLPRLHGATGRPMMSLAMFPVMVVGVGAVGVALTGATGGREGLRELWGRFTRTVQARWYAALLVPPGAILGVLALLSITVSPRFTPRFNAFGIAAGALSGFCEEVGWTGFAYPLMRARLGWLRGALLLGVLWGIWHLPVVDSLGAASPHGVWWPEFFGSFVAVVVALRVLIAWVYNHTGSLRMAQLLHASSTGFMVMLSAPRVTPAEEALWYLLYACVLGVVAACLVLASRRTRTVPAAASAMAQ